MSASRMRGRDNSGGKKVMMSTFVKFGRFKFVKVKKDHWLVAPLVLIISGEFAPTRWFNRVAVVSLVVAGTSAAILAVGSLVKMGPVTVRLALLEGATLP